jgi:hypothetical protein
MSALFKKFTNWSQEVYQSFFDAESTVQKIQDEKDAIDPNASARRAAFIASGLSIDPRILIDARTGKVREGPEFREMLNDSLRQGTERAARVSGAPALMFKVQVDFANERMRGYAGFELRMKRELRHRHRHGMGEEKEEGEKEKERVNKYRMILIQSGSARKQSQIANILIYFTLQGYPRKSISEMRAANAALLKWHQGGYTPSLVFSSRQ